MVRCYLDICIGDSDKYTKAKASYDATCALLSQNASTYGLPPVPEQLSEEQRQILTELSANQPSESTTKSKSWLASAFSRKPKGLTFECPPSLLVGRLVFELSSNPGLAKTTGNFAALCTGEKGMCKNAPKKPLWYKGCSVHRIVKGYVAQGGDITRGDGSGGESIYGGKFNDEKVGFKIRPGRGSLAMANSGKNSNTSQFFVILTDADAQLAKISGKYVVFGQLIDGWDVLERLDRVGTGDGMPREPVWIEDCGLY